MPRYRRSRVPGGTYFFTLITHDRQQFLTTPLGRRCLRQAIEQVREKQPFEITAFVLLPQHLHAIWALPVGDADYSTRWQWIKRLFTEAFRVESDNVRHRQEPLWQKRFWEHTCMSEEDVAACADYIHWNPVKHGLVDHVRDYPYSSFHRHVNEGTYPPDWGSEEPKLGFDMPD